MSIAVKVQGLSKKFGVIQALNDVSFSIKEGKFLGSLDPTARAKPPHCV
ncbi:MAG: hypothetical protein ACBZ72_02865 [Candidatus Bathyarchaeia archaeon]